MPEEGHVSILVKDADGAVVRQLLNSEFRKQGEHTASWDGLTTPIWKTPGKVVEPGGYTWSAIYHTGIGLRLRGWAYHGPNDPWGVSPTTFWGGDQALPVECITDGDRIYLGWAGAEAGKALIACDLDHNVLWAAGYHFNGVTSAAVDGDIVYYASGSVIKRVGVEDGKPVKWKGRNSANLKIEDLWEDPLRMPTGIGHGARESIAAYKGKLYVSFANWTFERRDVLDWRALLVGVVVGALPGKDHSPVSAAIWGKLDDRCQKAIKDYLAGRKTEDEAFKHNAYWIPDVRDVVIKTLKGLLGDNSFVKDGDKLSGSPLAQANRRMMEKTYGAAVVKMRTDIIAVLDGDTGKLLKTLKVRAPGKMFMVRDDLMYVLSERSKILAFNPQTGSVGKVVVEGLEGAGAMTVDKDGEIYVSNGKLCDEILVYSPDGKLLRTIGEKGTRVDAGPWNQNALRYVWGMAVDARGNLWAAETTPAPKRMSVWNAKTGEFVTEYFGATHYGASGGAVNPRDPNLLVGEGAEFRIDPKTGRSKLLGMITDQVYHRFARFCEGKNGKLYFTAAFTGRVWGPEVPPQIRIWERLGDGDYAWRATIRKEKDKTIFWADANDDGEEQDEETTSLPMPLGFSGYNSWSMGLNTNFTFYGAHKGKGYQIKVKGFTKSNAPIYDLENLKELPRITPGALSSPDDRLILSCDAGDKLFRCYEIETGKLLWTYPNTFHGVHGSHRAPGPKVGMIRGAFGIIGNAQLPEPIGAVWAINTNVGEWHVLTEEGYYLTRLFQGGRGKIKYPEKAAPGVDVTNIPPGLGGEDFGGSMIQGKDGNLYIQAGKISLWDIEVVGLDTVKKLKGGRLKITPEKAFNARIVRGRALQDDAKPKSTTVKMRTPKFTGNISSAFGRGNLLRYQKNADAAVTSAIAWDDKNLYLAWEVKDATPWTNGAGEVEYMYATGDTVDFQLATDPNAGEKRTTAAAGDLRLSIGNFKGKPTALVYREVVAVGAAKDPRTFSSGVVAKHIVESVKVLKEAKIEVKLGENTYTVEAAIPLAALGLKITEGMKTKGDFGVTHGNANAQDTVLRTYWSNQATGIVSDEVFELKLEPRNWGELTFEE